MASHTNHYQGSAHPRSILTERMVEEMRRRFRAGDPTESIARDAGVTIQTALDAIRGRKWGHVPGAVLAHEVQPCGRRPPLSCAQVVEIQKAFLAGSSVKDLANRYGVYYTTVLPIVRECRAERRKIRDAGRRPPGHGVAVGVRCATAKLDDAKVVEMREQARAGVPSKELARRFDVDDATARAAIYGKTWRHVPGALTAPPPGWHVVLDAATITRMRKLARLGIRVSDICREFGVLDNTARPAINGARWTHVTEPPPPANKRS
jgi:hypothetical protein